MLLKQAFSPNETSSRLLINTLNYAQTTSYDGSRTIVDLSLNDLLPLPSVSTNSITLSKFLEWFSNRNFIFVLIFVNNREKAYKSRLSYG